MSLQIVCAVYDVKAECYGRPIFVSAPGLAVRAFLDEIRNPESQMHRYPEDFRLFQISEYNDETAGFMMVAPVKLLMDGAVAAAM